MFGTDYFQFVHGESHDVGELTPTGTFDSLEVGTFMERQPSYPDSHSRPCENTSRQEGFLVKKVTTDGPSYERMSLGYPNLETKKGHKVTLRVPAPGAIIEAEGEPSKAYNASSVGHLVTSGTGAITTGTALETALALKNGRWYAAQTGDRVCGLYKGNLTPHADASNVRCRIQIFDGGIKA